MWRNDSSAEVRRTLDKALKSYRRGGEHKHMHARTCRRGERVVVLPPKACFITKFMMMAFNSLLLFDERCYIQVQRERCPNLSEENGKMKSCEKH